MNEKPVHRAPASGTLRLLAAACTVLPLAAAGCSALGLSGDSGTPPSTVTVPAERTDLQIEVPADGYLEATDSKAIAVPQVPTGALRVKELVDEGSIVRKGDVVLVFDDTQLNIDLDNHKASFRSANRQIDSTQYQSEIDKGNFSVMKQVAQLERDTVDSFDVDNEEIFSKLDILDAKVRKKDAGETILFADASLLLKGEYYDIEEKILGVKKRQVSEDMGRVETSLGNLVLKAPIGGLVLYKKNWRGSSVAVGDTLWPGNVVLSIVDPASAALTAFVLERDAAGVEVGEPARISIDARPERQFHGKVTKVAEISRPIERNSPVKYTEVQVSIDNPAPGILKPGMKGRAWISAGKATDTVVVPRAAIRGDPDAPFVLVEDPHAAGGSERRDVKLGLGDLVKVSVTAGLEGGEKLLVAQASAKPGGAAHPAAPAGGPPGKARRGPKPPEGA